MFKSESEVEAKNLKNQALKNEVEGYLRAVFSEEILKNISVKTLDEALRENQALEKISKKALLQGYFISSNNENEVNLGSEGIGNINPNKGVGDTNTNSSTKTETNGEIFDKLVIISDAFAHNPQSCVFISWHELAHNGIEVQGKKNWEGWLARAGNNDTVRSIADSVKYKYVRHNESITDLRAVEEAIVDIFASYKTQDWRILEERHNVAINDDFKKPKGYAEKLWNSAKEKISEIFSLSLVPQTENENAQSKNSQNENSQFQNSHIQSNITDITDQNSYSVSQPRRNELIIEKLFTSAGEKVSDDEVFAMLGKLEEFIVQRPDLLEAVNKKIAEKASVMRTSAFNSNLEINPNPSNPSNNPSNNPEFNQQSDVNFRQQSYRKDDRKDVSENTQPSGGEQPKIKQPVKTEQPALDLTSQSSLQDSLSSQQIEERKGKAKQETEENKKTEQNKKDRSFVESVKQEIYQDYLDFNKANGVDASSINPAVMKKIQEKINDLVNDAYQRGGKEEVNNLKSQMERKTAMLNRSIIKITDQLVNETKKSSSFNKSSQKITDTGKDR